jgi:hypothetical protein
MPWTPRPITGRCSVPAPPTGTCRWRSDDVITLPAAGGGTVAVHPFRLRAPFSELGAKLKLVRSAVSGR